jgi:hypothetical protein
VGVCAKPPEDARRSQPIHAVFHLVAESYQKKVLRCGYVCLIGGPPQSVCSNNDKELFKRAIGPVPPCAPLNRIDYFNLSAFFAAIFDAKAFK